MDEDRVDQFVTVDVAVATLNRKTYSPYLKDEMKLVLIDYEQDLCEFFAEAEAGKKCEMLHIPMTPLQVRDSATKAMDQVMAMGKEPSSALVVLPVTLDEKNQYVAIRHIAIGLKTDVVQLVGSVLKANTHLGL